MTVAEAVGSFLAGRGVRHVFGLIGSGNFHVTNALTAAGARFIAARHEAGAVTMADAYARITGEIGVCSVHQGPGLTNTLTGLAEAAKSRTPLLVLAADTASAAIHSNFRIEQANLVAAVGAIPERLHTPASALADTARAWRRARLESRPVVLMMPLDVQAAAVAGSAPPLPPVDPVPVRPAETAVQAVVKRLEQARRPLLIAGRGAVRAGAGPDLERLSDRTGALLATSAVAHGLFAGNPWCLGIAGGFASAGAAELMAAADLVLAFGVALNMWSTRHGRLFNPDAVIVQIDHEADAIGRHHRVDLGVVGDAGETARALLEALERRGTSIPGWRTPELEGTVRAAAWHEEPYDDAGDGERIDPRTLSLALDGMLPAERVVAVDSGHFMGYPAMYLRVPDARGFVFTQGFQAVGLGLATAIGAAVALPERLTVAALGDGGALMGAADLETVTRLGLRMLIVVYNDAAYGAEVHHFGPQGHPLDLVRFPDFDFAPLGRAVGMEAVTVRRVEDLEPVRRWCEAGARGAMLVDAKVVPTVVAEWLEGAFKGH